MVEGSAPSLFQKERRGPAKSNVLKVFFFSDIELFPDTLWSYEIINAKNASACCSNWKEPPQTSLDLLPNVK